MHDVHGFFSHHKLCWRSISSTDIFFALGMAVFAKNSWQVFHAVSEGALRVPFKARAFFPVSAQTGFRCRVAWSTRSHPGCERVSNSHWERSLSTCHCKGHQISELPNLNKLDYPNNPEGYKRSAVSNGQRKDLMRNYNSAQPL